ARNAPDLGHEPPAHALRRRVRRDLVPVVGVRVAPRVQQISRLTERDALPAVACDPREVLESLHHVVRVAEADRSLLAELLETPCAADVLQEDPDHACRGRREQRAERPRGGPDVALSLLLDEDVLEGEMTIAGEIDVTEPVVLEDPRTLGADVDSRRDRVSVCDL